MDSAVALDHKELTALGLISRLTGQVILGRFQLSNAGFNLRLFEPQENKKISGLDSTSIFPRTHLEILALCGCGRLRATESFGTARTQGMRTRTLSQSTLRERR
jgi:hypothetical protein